MDPLNTVQHEIRTLPLRNRQSYLIGTSPLLNHPMGSRLYQVTGDGIRFKVNSATGMKLKLHSQMNSNNCLYMIVIGNETNIEGCNGDTARQSTPRLFPINEWQEFWLTCDNEVIEIGLTRQNPFIQLKRTIKNYETDIIGYVEFLTEYRNRHVKWIFKESPVDLTPVKHRKVEGGELTWVPMRSGDPIPIDAMIGGFDKEPTYIIRANHNRSNCPGKYVPSLKTAYVAWGGREHHKTVFEMLCGFNALWVWTHGAHIPDNAFIAGTSEVRGEPLYIGRAMHEGFLVHGKVHPLYSLCYLPFRGKEVEASVYEILIQPDLELDQECELMNLWG